MTSIAGIIGPIGIVELFYIAGGLAVLACVWRWGYYQGKAEALSQPKKDSTHSIS